MNEHGRIFVYIGVACFINIIFLAFTGYEACFIAVPFFMILTLISGLYKKPSVYVLFLVTVSLALSSLSFTVKYVVGEEKLPEGEKISISGVLADHPKQTQSMYRLELKDCKVNGSGIKSGMTLYTADEAVGVAVPSDNIEFVGEIMSTAENGKNALDKLRNSGAVRVYAKDGVSVSAGDGDKLIYKIYKLRKEVSDKIYTLGGAENAAVEKALITGDTSDIPERVRANFRISGISHIFAVSGMHLSIWTGVIFFLLGKRHKLKILPHILSLVFIWFYVIFTGFSPSVIRSGIMLTVSICGMFFGGTADSRNSLGLAAAAMLLYDPGYAADISFLFSFASTLALVSVAKVLQGEPEDIYALIIKFTTYDTGVKIKNGYVYAADMPKTKLLKFLFKRLISLKNGLLSSAAVIFMCIPLNAVFFGYVSLLSPLSSMLCTLPAQGVMLFTAAGLFMPTGSLPAKLLFKAAGLCVSAILRLTEKLLELSFALCPVSAKYILPWFAAVIIVSLAAFYIGGRQKYHALISLLCGVLVLIGTAFTYTSFTKDNINVYIPESGNSPMICMTGNCGGSSVFIGSGGNYNAVTDAKGFFSSETVTRLGYMIVPRRVKGESGSIEVLTKSCEPLNCVNSGYGVNNIYADEFAMWLYDDIYFEFINTEELSAGVLTLNGHNIVMCFYAASDMGNAGEKYMSGDMLICKGDIPQNIDTNSFGNIVIMTDRALSGLPSNVLTTYGSGGISFSVSNKKISFI